MPKKGKFKMANGQYDFSGYATKNDLLCDDGRIIRKDAFKDCDGKIVPLVWNHGGRADPKGVIGHCLLENRKDGMYMYGKFNDTENGIVAKQIVNNGDVTGLSVWANKLVEKGKDVLHGTIREVSVVLAGANPGALIDSVMQHDSDSVDSVYIYLNGDEYCELKHSSDTEAPPERLLSEEEPEIEPEEEEKEEEVDEELEENEPEEEQEQEPEPVAHSADEGNEEDDERAEFLKVIDSLTDEQKEAVRLLIHTSTGIEDEDQEEEPTEAEGGEIEHSQDSKKDFKAILDSLTEDQKVAVGMLIESIMEDDEDDDDNKKNNKGDNDMKHNVFEGENGAAVRDINGLFKTALADIKKYGSLKDSVMAHAAEFGYDDDIMNEMKGASLQHATDSAGNTVTYGIADINYLFPEARTLNAVPRFIQRDNGWVDKFMNSTHKSPFSRVKCIFADITADEARAKGYIKGNKKVDEVFTLLKRTTDAYTVTKKQRLDRDDIIDITDFDVVAWMRQEMQVMLKEEVARAALVGDGRSASSPDKISPLHIRPIYTDDDLYAIKAKITVPSNANDDMKAKAFIRAAIKARKDYKGAGNPTLYTTADMLTAMLLLEDGIGRSLFDTVDQLATKLRVKEIVEVPVMENLSRTEDSKSLELSGIIVNPVDYNFGADNGGRTAFFEDFDIDYNQQKYLLETRVSGALVTPYSAIVLEMDPSGEAVSGGNG